MFVDAVNATFNSSYDTYTVDCAQLTGGPNVKLNLADGSTIALKPSDYIVPYSSSYSGVSACGECAQLKWLAFQQTTCWLYVRGFFDENNPSYQGYSLTLGQQFLNSRCYSYNFVDNSFGLTNVLGQ